MEHPGSGVLTPVSNQALAQGVGGSSAKISGAISLSSWPSVVAQPQRLAGVKPPLNALRVGFIGMLTDHADHA